ncbi:UAA transporter [Polychytrium aggregatum]|uniref:UAA transporter n=1 Tax=Polychytrium aggregatum TaxID=110093 RepID=UPI0022FE9F6E|nr:UAA transporter [Polychytrium aggregatum]KAI9207637.1 UAA transporter [Polychytrium aggregatum]
MSRAYAELAFCVIGIYACFLTWGLVQERVTKQPYVTPDGERQFFKYFIVLNVVQALLASVVGYVFLRIKGSDLGRPSSELIQKYVQLSILNSSGSPFGYMALSHIDYPTMILGKSCKLIPVMIMNFVIYRKTFPPYKYLVVLLVTVGVSAFMMLHEQEGTHKRGAAASSLWGLFLLSINLFVDGATNSTQDQVFHKYKVSGTQMMTFMNFFSSILMILYLLLNPYSAELRNALVFCSLFPRVMLDVVLFGLCGAIGQCFIYHTLERFGSLSLVTVTVTRKMFSILLSLFVYSHKLSLGQWVAVGIVFLGIAVEAYAKPSSGGSRKLEAKKPAAGSPSSASANKAAKKLKKAE